MKITNRQKGSSILVVVMVISVIGIISSASMRSALTSKEQANLSLVKQVIDSENSIALFNLSSFNPSVGINNTIHTLADNNPDKEIVYCVGGNNTPTSIMQWPSTSATPNNAAAGLNGYCKVGNLNKIKGERVVTLTQVSVRRDTTKLPGFISNDKKTTGKVYVATVTSLMPGLSNATSAAIDTCLNSRVNNTSMITHTQGTDIQRKSVVECLVDLGVPATASTQTYIN